ncbi:hypothetical protein BDV12DRAFT_185562 [Aspergillus spectabilis]
METPTATNPIAGAAITIEGTLNFRGFGGYPSTLRPKCSTRDGFIYRSGHLEEITPTGLEQLRNLGITTIIDLTNSGEKNALFTDSPNESSHRGFKILSLPLAKKEFSVQQLSEKYRRYLVEGEKAIAESYVKLLIEGHEVIRDILLLIRDNPDAGFLIHCSMGKDRTGIVFAILLSLAGVLEDLVAEEYSRSESSLQAVFPSIAAAIKKAILPPLTDEEAMYRAGIVIKTDKEAMRLTLRTVEEKFGGTMKYLNECCGISLENLSRIQDILTHIHTQHTQTEG